MIGWWRWRRAVVIRNLAISGAAISIAVVAVLFFRTPRPAAMTGKVSWMAIETQRDFINVAGPIARQGEWVTNVNGT